jgi:hypothetical protein
MSIRVIEKHASGKTILKMAPLNEKRRKWRAKINKQKLIIQGLFSLHSAERQLQAIMKKLSGILLIKMFELQRSFCNFNLTSEQTHFPRN